MLDNLREAVPCTRTGMCPCSSQDRWWFFNAKTSQSSFSSLFMPSLWVGKDMLWSWLWPPHRSVLERNEPRWGKNWGRFIQGKKWLHLQLRQKHAMIIAVKWNISQSRYDCVMKMLGTFCERRQEVYVVQTPPSTQHASAQAGIYICTPSWVYCCLTKADPGGLFLLHYAFATFYILTPLLSLK